MNKIQEFFKLITSDAYIGWILLGIVILVVIIFVCIVMHYHNKKQKSQQDVIEYKKKELNNLSNEEIENIANNVADPETFYTTIEEEAQNQVEEKQEYIEEKASTTKTSKKEGVKKQDKKVNGAKKDKVVKEKTTDKKDKKVDANEEVSLDNKAEVNKEKTTDKQAVKKSNAKTTNKKPKQEEIVEVENTVVESDINNDVKKQSYSGKWKIKRDTDGKYFAELYASNGVKVLKTETNTSLSGAKNGIETIKKNITVGNFATSVDKIGR